MAVVGIFGVKVIISSIIENICAQLHNFTGNSDVTLLVARTILPSCGQTVNHIIFKKRVKT